VVSPSDPNVHRRLAPATARRIPTGGEFDLADPSQSSVDAAGLVVAKPNRMGTWPS